MLDINISTPPSTTNNHNKNNIKLEAQAWGEDGKNLSKCGLRQAPQPKIREVYFLAGKRSSGRKVKVTY